MFEVPPLPHFGCRNLTLSIGNMQHCWKFGLVAWLQGYFLSAMMRQSLDLFPDLISSLGAEEGHVTLLYRITGQKDGLKTSRPIDGHGVDGSRQNRCNPSALVQPTPKIEDQEIYQSSPKRQKLDLDFSLSLPAQGQDGTSLLPGSSSSPSQKRHSGGSSQPIYTISRGVYRGLETSSQAQSLIPLRKHKGMRVKSYEPLQIHVEDVKALDSSSNKSQNIIVGFEKRTQNKSKDAKININPTQIIPENREIFLSRTINLQVKPQFWAWISIVLSHLEESMADEFKSNAKPNMRSLMSGYLQNKLSGGKKITKRKL
ncbi:hypothetical protein PGT21_021369 [Puccinia graminis f. sp. tritici]|uniref:Uncharacterized protein n=1 Tax=Puccinia graminis f. sp. tritici TaxID=56615 RepID=A0A5B0RVM5_PUCGR|nr:hypothetical protein PGT21_021369 [Puccinia graminis f. sp. tritici]KAA1129155.1 hypothetical protein PGTUg99_032002 [Puccinia graminis f. sp. tritici]